MPAPETGSRSPGHEPEVPEGLAAGDGGGDAVVPGVFVRAVVEDYFCGGVGLDELGGEDGGDGVGEGGGVADEGVKVEGGEGCAAGRGAEPFLAAELDPFLGVVRFFVDDVPAVVGVVVAEGEEGVLEGFGAASGEADADYF